MMGKKIFQSKVFVFSLIFFFIFLITTEAAPRKVTFDSDEEFKPVVRVREAGKKIPAAQKERFEKLMEEGKSLFQEELDFEGSIKKFKEAQPLAVTQEQKAEVFFYLSLVYYATLEERGEGEFQEAIRRLIEVDYYRKLDRLICPTRYIESFQEIKEEFGALKVQSKPAGADVYLNERKDSEGMTPLTIGLKAGSVKIKVKKRSKEKKDVLEIVAGKEITSPLYILEGRSSLIYVIGGIVLAAGVVAILLLKGKPGKEGTASPTTGSIQVNSTPTGAKVFLDGNNTGETTNCTLTDISPGAHTVKLVKEGYSDYEGSVSVTAGQTTTVNSNLTGHTITVISPSSSIVWVKGEKVEIRWSANGSVSSQTSIRRDPGLNPGKSFVPSFQTRVLRFNRSFQSLMRMSKPLESTESSIREEVDINNQSRFQNLTEQVSPSTEKGRNPLQKKENIAGRARRSRIRAHRLAISPKFSNQGFRQLGNTRILILTNVKIELYKGDNLASTISSSTDNDGSFEWTVPATLADGTDYSLRVSCVDELNIYGTSEDFQITHGYVFVKKWGKNGTKDGQFDSPKGMALDGSGFIYVVDSYNHRIQKFTSDGTFVSKWGSEGSGDGQFDHPTGIAVDGSGFVYVADTDNNRIQKFTSDGTFVTNWGKYGKGKGKFDDPKGIAADGSGFIYVVDNYNDRIQKFISNGTFVTMWGSYGAGNRQFDDPTGIAVDGSDFVYVADTSNYRIQKFKTDGTFVSNWGSLGSSNGQFNWPRGVAVDGAGDVYVADTANSRIQKFKSDGTFMTKWGRNGTSIGKFDYPIGIMVDGAGFVYVADTDNHRIQKFGPASANQKNSRKDKGR